MDPVVGPARAGRLADTTGMTPQPPERGSRRWVPSGLWRHADFRHFWASESVSQVGTQVSLLALPLLAATTLGATPFQVGLLAAVESLPSLLLGLFAGVWIDRRRRRPLLIAADLGRAALLLIIPLAWALGSLSMGLLYAVAGLTGTLSLVHGVASPSYLPGLVPIASLLDGNGKLQASISTAQVAGPGLGGLLIAALGAPLAIATDAASFLVSAFFLGRIRAPEPAPVNAARLHVWREIGDGLGWVRREATVRALIACAATIQFFANAFFAVYVLYMSRDLGLGPGQIGLVFATGGVGALLGALLADPLRRRFGLGPTIVGGQLFFGVTGLAIPLAALLPAIALPMVVASEFLQWLGIVVASVNALSLRQSLTPEGTQGRVNATARFLTVGAQPLGSLLGGLLGGMIGLPWTLVVGEIGMLLAVGWLIASPVPRLRHNAAGGLPPPDLAWSPPRTDR